MRRITVWAPKGSLEQLVAAAQRHGSRETIVTAGEAPDDLAQVDVVVAHVPNQAVDAFVADLEHDLSDFRVSMPPQGVLVLRPPAGDAPDEVVEVGNRSPLEIVLSSLQSVGSLSSFLAYAAVSGAVVFAAFFTNTVFLLVGAMLISPLAEPAMNAAVATARGAGGLFVRSVGRYLLALAAGAAVAAALTVVYGVDEPTALMTDVSSPSVAAILLPLSAGIAGAVNIVTSERSSLVSGAGPGLLIAASLAPPMGLVGMAIVLGEPGILAAAAFLLALQLVGINLAAAIIFRAAGVRSTGMRYARGRPAVQRAIGAASVAALAVLLALQLGGSPNLRRESLERDAEAAARAALRATGGVGPVALEASHPREDFDEQRTVVVKGIAQRAAGSQADVSRLEAVIGRRVAAAVERALPGTTALVDIAVAAP